VALNLVGCSAHLESRNKDKKMIGDILSKLNEANLNATSEGKVYTFFEKSTFSDKRVQETLQTLTYMEYMNGHKEVFEIVNIIPVSSTRECWRIKRATGKLKLYKIKVGYQAVTQAISTVDECK
jgi:hypothetical protein